MPHIVIEYSANLDESIAASKITQKAHKAVVDSGLFSPDAVKARSVKFSDFVLPENAKNFVHITVSILTGRDAQQRKVLSQQIFETAKQAIEGVDKLSVNIHEMCAETYSK